MSNQGDGGESGDQSANQTAGQGGQPGGGQPAGGQPQGGAGQPAGGQAPGQQPVRRGPSAGDKIQAAFGEYAVKNQIKAIIGTYTLIGLGIGLAVILMSSMAGGATGGAGGAGTGGLIGVVFAAGPILAGVFGLSLSNKLPVGTMPAAVVSAAINYVGFVVLSILSIILIGTQMLGGGMLLGALLGPILVGGLAIALVAGLTTALGNKVDFPATREEAAAQEPPARPAPRQQTQQTQQP